MLKQAYVLVNADDTIRKIKLTNLQDEDASEGVFVDASLTPLVQTLIHSLFGVWRTSIVILAMLQWRSSLHHSMLSLMSIWTPSPKWRLWSSLVYVRMNIRLLD